jgi:hypothetical protein
MVRLLATRRRHAALALSISPRMAARGSPEVGNGGVTVPGMLPQPAVAGNLFLQVGHQVVVSYAHQMSSGHGRPNSGGGRIEPVRLEERGSLLRMPMASPEAAPACDRAVAANRPTQYRAAADPVLRPITPLIMLGSASGPRILPASSGRAQLSTGAIPLRKF